MTNKFLLTGLFSVAAALGWLGMVSIARADAEENMSHPINQAAATPDRRRDLLKGVK